MRIPRQFSLEPDALGTGSEALLPIVLTVDDSDSPRDVIDALALSPFVTGQQPYATTRHLNNVREDATLLPPDVRVVREVADGNEQARLATGDGWTLRAVHWLSNKTATRAPSQQAPGPTSGATTHAAPRRSSTGSSA